MIIVNGTIELKQKTATEPINPETGHPRKPTEESWGTPIPCQYFATKYSNLAKANGEAYRQSEFTVLIEEQSFTAEQLRLKDRDGNTVGEFSVIQVEPLEAVCELRIFI